MKFQRLTQDEVPKVEVPKVGPQKVEVARAGPPKVQVLKAKVKDGTPKS